MFDTAEAAPTFDNEAGRQPKSKTIVNLNILNVDELIRLRDEIDQKLPPRQLSEMNLEEETLLQFHTLRALQSEVLSDKEFALNQRVQLANSVSSTLQKMTELQKELYSTERFKMIENLLIRFLNRLPEETAAAFIAEYEKGLRAVNG